MNQMLLGAPGEYATFKQIQQAGGYVRKGEKAHMVVFWKEDIPAIFYKHYPAYVAGKLNVSELARVCGLSRPTVYKYLRLVG